MTVLQQAASLLDLPMVLRSLPCQDYNDEVRIGEQVGYLHDGCFIGFEEPSAELEGALLASVGAVCVAVRRSAGRWTVASHRNKFAHLVRHGNRTHNVF